MNIILIQLKDKKNNLLLPLLGIEYFISFTIFTFISKYINTLQKFAQKISNV
jgi:hypothetical protein